MEIHDKSEVLRRVVVIYFKFEDGSLVRSKCTACREIIDTIGMQYVDGRLHDVEVNKLIPLSYFKLDSKMYLPEEDNDERNELDKFLSDSIKRLW